MKWKKTFNFGGKMSEQVDEQIKAFEGKSDEEIMNLYINQTLSRFPSTIMQNAISIEMKRRGIEFKDISTIFNFKKEEKLFSFKVI